MRGALWRQACCGLEQVVLAGPALAGPALTGPALAELALAGPALAGAVPEQGALAAPLALLCAIMTVRPLMT